MEQTTGNLRNYIKPLSKEEFDRKIEAMPIDERILKLGKNELVDLQWNEINKLDNLLKTTKYSDLNLNSPLNRLITNLFTDQVDNILSVGNFSICKKLLNTNLYNKLSNGNKAYLLYNQFVYEDSSTKSDIEYYNMLVEKFKIIKDTIPNSREKIGLLIFSKIDNKLTVELIKENKQYLYEYSDFDHSISDEALLSNNYDAYEAILEYTTIDVMVSNIFVVDDLIKNKDKRYITKFLEHIDNYDGSVKDFKKLIKSLTPHIKF
jgi:hypothetical protein